MIRLSVLYPSTEGATFDHDYYRGSHVPSAVKAWSPTRTEVDRVTDGPYVAAVHFTFPSREALDAAMGGSETGAILADVANYTTITPVTVISEVVAAFD